MFHWAGEGTGSPYDNRVNLNDPAGGLDNPWLSYPGGNPFPTVLRKDVEFPTSVFYINYNINMKSSYVHQWNLSLQRQIGEDWMVAANYIGNSTIHLQTAVEGNPADIHSGQLRCWTIRPDRSWSLLLDRQYEQPAPAYSAEPRGGQVLRECYSRNG